MNPQVQFNANDPFWARNREFLAEAAPGCGMDRTGYPGITPLGGWDANTVQLAYRDFGQGRLWLVEADWQDNDVGGMNRESVDLMNTTIAMPLWRRPCSEVATDWCLAKGWRVTQTAQGGNLICNAPNVSWGSDCSACDTYNVITWLPNTSDRFCGTRITGNAGDVFSGHTPCECGDNQDLCESIPLDG